MPLKEMLFCPECYRSYGPEHGYCPEHGAHLVLLPAEESLVGRVVADRYRIVEELGVGGIGVVYRAEHTLIDRPIALKVFRGFLSDDPVAARRFDAEADASLQLKGRYTVQVYDSGRTEDGRLFLARELVEGPSLAEVIRGAGRLAPARALRAALDVARALEYAHARGVLHRALSPTNIFLVKTDGEELTRVSDFGQAAMLTKEDGRSLCPEGLACAALEYLSPEQAVGTACDVPSDLYALGVTLFEAMTGRPPFQADSRLELLLEHAQTPVPRFADVAADAGLPKPVEDLVRRLLAKRTKQRPTSARVLASELELLLKDPAVMRAGTARVEPDPSREPATVEPDPSREPATVEPDPSREPATVDLPEDPPRKSRLPMAIGIVVVLAILGVVGLFASGLISEKEGDTVQSETMDVTDTTTAPDIAGIASAPDAVDVIPDIQPEIIPDIQPEVIPDIQPEVIPDIQPEIIPDIQPEVIQDIQPEVIPDIQPEIIPDIQPDIVPDIQPDTIPDIHPDISPDVQPDLTPETKKPPETKEPPETKKPPEIKKPDPVIAKPAGMGEEDFALAKEQVAWGRKNMKKALWEMAILNFQQAQRMGLTDSAIKRYVKECRNHMAIVADALEKGHTAFLAGQWDEAIRQFQRARDHGEKNTTTFRMIEKAKEAKAKEEADKAEKTP